MSPGRCRPRRTALRSLVSARYPSCRRQRIHPVRRSHRPRNTRLRASTILKSFEKNARRLLCVQPHFRLQQESLSASSFASVCSSHFPIEFLTEMGQGLHSVYIVRQKTEEKPPRAALKLRRSSGTLQPVSTSYGLMTINHAATIAPCGPRPRPAPAAGGGASAGGGGAG